MFPNSTALLCADSANSASLRYLFLSLARHPFSHFETPVAQPATRSVPHEQSAVALSFTSSASFISSTSFSARRLLQQLDFLPRQSPKSPRLQIQNQRPHPHPPNLLHQMPHLFEHSPYLAVPPLNQHHLVPRILPVLKKPYLRWRGLHPPPPPLPPLPPPPPPPPPPTPPPPPPPPPPSPPPPSPPSSLFHLPLVFQS